MLLQYIIVLAVLLIVALLCIFSKKLTVAGAVMSVVVGGLFFLAAGVTGLLQLFTFFMLAVLATRHKKAQKSLHGAHAETRDVWQVLANGGMAALICVAAIFDHHHPFLYPVLISACIAAATADTLSSELGMVYGRRFFNILTFKQDKKGLDGVISMEGTLIGAAGAGIIALMYAWDRSTWVIAVAGIVGNIADSVLGATLERKGMIGNNMVNFLNTLVGALTAWILL